MTIEIIVLALASTIRPTSLAAIYALVSHESPRRLMAAYVAAGLVFTIGFGLLVIGAFGGINIGAGTGRAKGIAEIAGGILALGFGVLLLTGRVGGPQTDDAPDVPGRWRAMLEHRLTVWTAALAGPATHIPGLFYLIALNLIVAHEPQVPGALAEVLIYNVVWFALPIAALTICIVDPDAASGAMERVQTWTRRNTRTILVVASLLVGTALVVRGALTL